MKRFVYALLVAVLVLSGTVPSFALTDTKIFTDEVTNTYEGREEAINMINNLKFTDVPNNHWAKEAITRAGSLNMVKGYSNKYEPNASVTNQEAIAFVLRVMGLEDEAQEEGVRLQDIAESNKAIPAWTIGYLSLARSYGLLTDAQYNSALNPNQDNIAEGVAFSRTAPATREQVATWIVKGLEYLEAEVLTSEASQQKVYSFSDWTSTSAEHAVNVEKCVANGIMQGLSDGRFNPTGSLTRAEMAQILSNMDTIYNKAAGFEKVYGTVGGIKDVQSTETGMSDIWRNIYVRNNRGLIDVLQYQMESSSSPQAKTKDAVVLNNGAVTGLNSLQMGDEIEYLVSPLNNEVLFVKLTSKLEIKTVEGKLEDIDYANGQIHISDANKERFIYYIVDGLYGTDNTGDYVYFAEKKYYDKDLPYGAKLSLGLKNNIVDLITYIGEPVVVNEIKGIVVENNVGLGYLTVIDNNGREVTKNYYSNDIVVEKQQYYDVSDEIGYINQMFPNFQYDPRSTVISAIEPGDIVFIQTYANDAETIEKISASTNYVMKYGKVRQITPEGDISKLFIEYEDKQTTWFDVANDVFVSKNGKPIGFNDLQAGDWVKVLVNQAIITPGYVMESVKEVKVEGSGHEVSTIIKGQLGAINTLQKQMSIQHSYTLTKTGWADYQEIRQLSIDSSNIEFYHEGKQVSLDYAQQFLKRADGNVYVALENNYAGDKVAMVSFRNYRGDVLDSDTVIDADGTGSFSVLSNNAPIATDSGTIVRRHGRLVTGSDIMIPDYAQVELNGGSKAAVVDIYDKPDTSKYMIARGRIMSVDEGKSFKVKSMAQLSDVKWTYSPVEREFSIDHETIFINESGRMNQSDFIDYTENTVINDVYTVIADGTKAAYVIECPYTNKAVRGTVYNASSGSVAVKDTTCYDGDTGNWSNVSNIDNTLNIILANNTVIIKNNQIVSPASLQNGDKLKVYTNSIPSKVTSGANINGYIILVEN